LENITQLLQLKLNGGEDMAAMLPLHLVRQFISFIESFWLLDRVKIDSEAAARPSLMNRLLLLKKHLPEIHITRNDVCHKNSTFLDQQFARSPEKCSGYFHIAYDWLQKLTQLTGQSVLRRVFDDMHDRMILCDRTGGALTGLTIDAHE
jgi:hypothetical protein